MGKGDFPRAGGEATWISSGVDFEVLAMERFGIEDVLPVIRAKTSDSAQDLSILVGKGVLYGLKGGGSLGERTLN